MLDDKIIMDLVVNQDSCGEVIVGILFININEVIIQVLVGNGEIVVFGGIFQFEVVIQIIKILFLGDIFYLGCLFKWIEYVDECSELLIFIILKIFKNDLIC